MHHAVAIIQDLPPGPVVIVASAMAGVTDRLLGLALVAADGKPGDNAVLAGLRRQHVDTARQIIRTASTRRVVLAAIETSLNELRALLDGLRVVRELTPRTSDYIAARGERLSAMLLAAALADTRRRVRLLDAVELIVTDGHFGAAAPDFAATDRRVRRLVGPLLQRGVIPVIPGFIGAGPGGDLVTLGRGGSDLTATLLARALSRVGGFALEGRAGLPHRRSAGGGRRARHPASCTCGKPRSWRTTAPRCCTRARSFRSAGGRSRCSSGPSRTRHRKAPRCRSTAAARRSPVRAVSGIGAQALVTVTGNGMLGVPGVAARTFERCSAPASRSRW